MVSLSSVKLRVAVGEDLTVVILTSTANATLSDEAASDPSNPARALLDTLMSAESQEMRDTRISGSIGKPNIPLQGVRQAASLSGVLVAPTIAATGCVEVGGDLASRAALMPEKGEERD